MSGFGDEITTMEGVDGEQPVEGGADLEAVEEDMMMEEEVVDPWGWKEAGWDRKMPTAGNL